MTEPSAAAELPKTYLWDDNPATTDLLGFDVVVDAVTAALRETHLDPITIGVHAPWGGGKSTVLELIGKAKDERWLVIRTNPWEYDDQLDPKGTLVTEILTAISREVKEQAGLKDEIAKLVNRVSWSRLGVAVASGVMTMRWDPKEFIEALNPENDDSIQSLAQFRKEFSALVEKLPEVDRVVVLVDDLDRCLPDAVMATMEAIKLFLSVKGMAFVIAADQGMVKNAIQANLERSNRSQIFADRYLEKIVQLPVPLPRLAADDAEAYITLLLAYATLGEGAEFNALVDHCAARREANDPPFLAEFGAHDKLTEVVITLASQLAQGLSAEQLASPREIKRFLNAYGIRARMAEKRHLGVKASVIIKLLFLEDRLPKDFDLLAATAPGDRPTLLNEWEAWGREDTDSTKPEKVSDASRPWAAAAPRLAEEDLNPYLTLAASLAASRLSAGLSDTLRQLVRRILGGVRADADEAIDEAKQLTAEEQVSVVQALLAEARRDADHIDGAMIAAVALGAAAPEHASDIADEVRTQLAGRMNARGAAELGGSRVEAFQQLAREIADNANEDPGAREAARQSLETV